MTIKQTTLMAILIPFALIGYGESYGGVKQAYAESKVERIKISTEELLGKAACQTNAGKADKGCPNPPMAMAPSL